MGDSDAARRRAMVDRLRDAEITDERVLAAMGQVPREHFVSDAAADQAYADWSVPIAADQTMSMPWIVAVMTEALQLSGPERVLEIGTGSGYAAAVLSRLCRSVSTVERHRELVHAARDSLSALGFDNVQVLLADGSLGAPEHGPFNAISVTAMAEDRPPDALLNQLTPDGALVCPIGQDGRGHLMRFRHARAETLTPAGFVPLVPGIATGP